MYDYDLMVKLERIITDLVKVDGVDGSLIVDSKGNIIAQRILQDIDVKLFGPMANVITSSSMRLFNSSHQGEIHRVLVESLNGKALFLNLENVHLIVLMKNQANVGLILVSSKRSAEKIITLTKDLKPELVEPEIEIETSPMEIESKEVKTSGELVTESIHVEKSSTEHAEKPVIEEITSFDEPYIEEKTLKVETESEEKTFDTELNVTEIPAAELEIPSNANFEDEDELNVHKEVIPIIKPPIAFPDIKKITEVPADTEARSDLILDIYEAIFRAMSIGASKIMGVAPARGLTQKFLPSKECKKLLEGVNVKSNSTIDFKKIRENAALIDVNNRESQFIDDFTKILDVITDNYGQVMGYEAFRGMVRPEFKKITDSYGPVMKKLGITNKMHPEISELFELIQIPSS